MKLFGLCKENLIFWSCRNVTINDKRMLFCSRLFVTLPQKMANLLRLGKKKNIFFCFALDFS